MVVTTHTHTPMLSKFTATPHKLKPAIHNLKNEKEEHLMKDEIHQKREGKKRRVLIMLWSGWMEFGGPHVPAGWVRVDVWNWIECWVEV